MADARESVIDHYAVLGVTVEASEQEIRRAYRTLSLRLHPDRNRAADATARFQQVAAAYEVLSDSEKRRRYDLSRAAPPRRRTQSMAAAAAAPTSRFAQPPHAKRTAGPRYPPPAASSPTSHNQFTPPSHASASPPPLDHQPLHASSEWREQLRRAQRGRAMHTVAIDVGEYYRGSTTASIATLTQCTVAGCRCDMRGYYAGVCAVPVEFTRAFDPCSEPDVHVGRPPAGVSLWGTHARHCDDLYVQLRCDPSRRYEAEKGVRWAFYERSNETSPYDLLVELELDAITLLTLQSRRTPVTVRHLDGRTITTHDINGAGYVAPVAGGGIGGRGKLYIKLVSIWSAVVRDVARDADIVHRR